MSLAEEREEDRRRIAALTATVRQLTYAVGDLAGQLSDDRRELAALRADLRATLLLRVADAYREHPLAVCIGAAVILYVLGDVACALAYRMPLAPFPSIPSIGGAS